jgi:hypothetical protein
LAVREGRGALLRRRLELGQEFRRVGGRPLGLSDQGESSVAALVEPVLDEVEPVLSVGARHAEAVTEQTAEVGDPINPEGEQEQPQDDDLLPVADHPVRPGLHIAS